jgi:hypothetical protein
MAANDTFPGTSPKRRGGGGRQAAVLAELLSRPTQKAAAEACGISLSTIQRWLREPEFAEQYRQAKSELVTGATMRLRSNAIEAVEALHEVAKEKANPPAARVSAARAILEFMFAAHELEDLAVRLDKLEQERGNDDQS